MNIVNILNIVNTKRMNNMLTRNLLFGVLMLLLIAGALLGTPQDALADAPTITGVAITSDPGTDKTYTKGDTVEITVTFSEAVNVTGGFSVWMVCGGWEYRPGDKRGSGTTKLVFSDTIIGDSRSSDGDGITIKPNANGNILTPSPNTSTITAVIGGEQANLAHSGISNDSNHKVDATKQDTAPTVTFNEPTGTQAGDTFDVSIKFDQNVSGFTADDIKVITTRTSGTGDATVTLTGSDKRYTATVTSPTIAKGTVKLEVAKDAAYLQENPRFKNAKTVTNNISFDTTVATVSFTEPTGTQAGNTFDIKIDFSKDVTDLTTSDITLTTTRTSGTGDATFTLSGSDSDYTVTVTSPTTAKGSVTLEIAADAVTDGTRTGPASKATSSAINFDTTVATVSFNEPLGTQTANTFTVPFNFSKDVTEFIANDITVTTTHTSGTGDATVALSGSGKSYTATVTSPTTAKGTITLEVAKNAVTDGTRTGPASKATSNAINFDTTGITVSFSEPAGTQVAQALPRSH